MNANPRPSPDDLLRDEFNRWAEEGKGEEMERHHLDITQKTVQRMEPRPGERVLDLGCGAGWATRLLARLVGEGPEGFGQVVGLDISDDTPSPERYSGRWFRDVDELNDFKRIGALLVIGRKPDVRNPAPAYTIY